MVGGCPPPTHRRQGRISGLPQGSPVDGPPFLCRVPRATSHGGKGVRIWIVPKILKEIQIPSGFV